jgi:TatD DNase family protein
MSVPLTDTHCHLNFNSYEADLENVLARADEAGLERLLIPAIDLPSGEAVVAMAESYPQIFAAVGVHPNEARSWGEESLSRLRALAAHPKVVAIGEIGLDYYRDRAPRELQQRVLRQQLELAAELRLPVILHNRQAGRDLLEILRAWQMQRSRTSLPLAARPGVLHSFSAEAEISRQAISLDFFIGVSGPVTFLNARKLQHVIASLPLERLLVETDAPFLTPHPFRGQRNEPAYVRLIAEKIAELHAQSFAAVAQITTANARRLFNW